MPTQLAFHISFFVCKYSTNTPVELDTSHSCGGDNNVSQYPPFVTEGLYDAVDKTRLPVPVLFPTSLFLFAHVT
jgi:hypothetical protein